MYHASKLYLLIYKNTKRSVCNPGHCKYKATELVLEEVTESSESDAFVEAVGLRKNPTADGWHSRDSSSGCLTLRAA